MKFADFFGDFLDDLEGDISSSLMKLGGLGWVCSFLLVCSLVGFVFEVAWCSFLLSDGSTARSISCDVSSSRLDPVV